MAKKSITAHCIVRNEENFISYAIKSVIDYVDKILLFDTGSNDNTLAEIQKLVLIYPDKIIFEQKGECDKKKHTQLRQEMLDRTNTDWFMILDGDEVYPRRTMEEAVKIINTRNINWFGSPYYTCVGDIFHTYYNEKFDNFFGQKGFFTARFIRKSPNIEFRNDYELDSIYYKNGGQIFEKKDIVCLENKYWHLTYLRRSTEDDSCYTTGIEKTRVGKRRLTYFIIGRRIKETVPEVFSGLEEKYRLPFLKSFINFLKLLGRGDLLTRALKLLFRKIIKLCARIIVVKPVRNLIVKYRKMVSIIKILFVDLGYYRSVMSNGSVDKNNKPLPWFTYPAIEFLKQLDLRGKTVFEYGAGFSSIFFAEKCKGVISVENNKQWCDKINNLKKVNNEIIFAESGRDFINAIARFDRRFDVIVIDGESERVADRFECAQRSYEYLAEGGMIILDNSEWFPGIGKYFQEKDLIQIDFSGFCPINGYTSVTSFFIKRDVKFKTLSGRQPDYPIGSIRHLII